MELRDEDIAEYILTCGFRDTVVMLMRQGHEEKEAIRKVRKVHDLIQRGSFGRK